MSFLAASKAMKCCSHNANSCNTASSFSFAFNWSFVGFRKQQDESSSPVFRAQAPFADIGWRLLVNPNSKGFVSVVLELVKAKNSKRLDKNTLDSLVISSKIGILNRTNKMIDFVQDEDNFAVKPCSKAKCFLRFRLLGEAENILRNDSMTFRAEITYNEQLIERLVPAADSSDFQRLFERELFTDVLIKVRDEGGLKWHEIRAHKALLIARSSVFEAMLTRDMIEKRRNEIEISDLDFDVVKELLGFIYTGFVGNLEKYAIDLLLAADKYDLQQLGLLCERYLARNLNIRNVLDVLLTSTLLNLVDLKECCFELIVSNGHKLSDFDDLLLKLAFERFPDLMKDVEQLMSN